MEERWLSPKEMAERLGVTAKALRVYERAGLVTPLRTTAGWRAYGPTQAAQLHQLLALKRMGLSLRQISGILAGGGGRLATVLTLQERLLEARRDAIDTALGHLRAARAKLARDGALSTDDLIKLTKDTAMPPALKTDDDWREAFGPIIAQHYTPEQIEEIGQRKLQAFSDAGYDEPGFTLAWGQLFAEARALKAADDHASPRASALVRRWNEMMSHFTQGDPELTRKTQAIWADASADPAVAPRLPIQPDVFAFVQKIAEGMRARGELPPRP
jgi:MerR family transcriptional regulator, thiopeptide resistance regulator